jgi:hypothetical protein
VINLIEKVLEGMSTEKKDRCRHSANGHTVVAYKMLNRVNDITYVRVDIFKTQDLNKKTTKESQLEDDL